VGADLAAAALPAPGAVVPGPGADGLAGLSGLALPKPPPAAVGRAARGEALKSGVLRFKGATCNRDKAR